MNLKPSKKDNIYCSFNNINAINDITKEMNQKSPEKKDEENNLLNNDSNNNNKNNNNMIHRYQELYQNTQRLSTNESKKGHVPLNIYFNNNINKSNNAKRPLGIFKNPNIITEIPPLKNEKNNVKVNKLNQLEDSFNINQIRHINKPILLNNNSKNRINTFEGINANKNKIFIEINDFNYENSNNQFTNRNKNQKEVKLPSLSGSNMNTFGNIRDSNRNTAHFKESQESNLNNKSNPQDNNNNVIVLPNINSQRYLNKK